MSKYTGVLKSYDMKPITNNNKALANVLMVFLVCVWGMEYIAAKTSQTAFDTMTIVFMKYTLAILVVTVMKLVTGSQSPIRKRDIPLFIACSLLGQVMYFYCEYKAMNYMPVGLITVVLAFLPICSLFTEWALYNRRPTGKMLVGVLFCIMGVALIIGVDIEAVLNGQFIGYLLCCIALFFWNAYNFVAESLTDRYDQFSLTFNQMLCTILITLPMGLAQFPGFSAFDDPKIIMSVCFQGLICSGFGFSIYMFSLKKLGSTTMAVYNNFLPVTTAILGWLLLGEVLAGLQIAGMAITIIAGFIVIKEKANQQKKDNAQ